jgi:hypothetical protein
MPPHKQTQNKVIFDKEHILTLWKYQLHLAFATTHCLSGITDELQKRKVPLK